MRSELRHETGWNMANYTLRETSNGLELSSDQSFGDRPPNMVLNIYQDLCAAFANVATFFTPGDTITYLGAS